MLQQLVDEYTVLDCLVCLAVALYEEVPVLPLVAAEKLVGNVLRSLDDVTFSVAPFRVEVRDLRESDECFDNAVLSKLVVARYPECHRKYAFFEHPIQGAEAFF
jgi:hypothetical protein